MSIGLIKGKLRPIRDHVLVADMDFDEVQTSSGIYLPNQNGKTGGIKPRWGRVWAVGPQQQDVEVGDWIYVDHGRWTRGMTVEDENGGQVTVRRVDNKDILIKTSEKPNDVYLPE